MTTADEMPAPSAGWAVAQLVWPSVLLATSSVIFLVAQGSPGSPWHNGSIILLGLAGLCLCTSTPIVVARIARDDNSAFRHSGWWAALGAISNIARAFAVLNFILIGLFALGAGACLLFTRSLG